MNQRVAGLIAIGVGVVVVFIAAAADVIGISSGGSAELFGKRQIIGTVLGVAIVAVGLALFFIPRRGSGSASDRRR